MAELARCNEYSMKISAEQLSIKRVSDISGELWKKQLKIMVCLIGIVGSLLAFPFSDNSTIQFEIVFVFAISIIGLYNGWKDSAKFSKKEFVEIAKKD